MIKALASSEKYLAIGTDFPEFSLMSSRDKTGGS